MTPTASDREEQRSITRPLLLWGRRIALALAGLAVGTMILTGLLLAALQIDAVSGYVVRTGAGWASSDSLRIRVAGASGSWVRGLELTGVDVAAGATGAPTWTFTADTLSARYRLLPLLRRHVAVPSTRAVGIEAWISLAAIEEEPQEEPTTDSPWTIAVDQVDVGVRELTVVASDTTPPWVLSGGRLRVADLVAGDEGVRAILDTLDASFRPPGRPAGWGRLEASGILDVDRMQITRLVLRSPESDVRAHGSVPLTLAGTAPEGLDLDLALAPLHLEDLAPFLPEMIPDSLRVRGGGRLWATRDTAHVRFAAGTDVPGEVSIEGRIWGPRSSPDLTGDVTLTALDLQAWGLTDSYRLLAGALRAELAEVSPEDLRRMHGAIMVEGHVDDADGSLGRIRADARADVQGGPWRAGWRASGLGLDASGAATLLLERQPEWALDGALTYTDTEGHATTASPDTDGEQAFRPVAGAASFEAAGRGFDPDSLTGRLRLRMDSVQARIGHRATLTRIGPGEVSAEVERGHAALRMGTEAGGGRVDLTVDGDLSARTIRSLRGTVAKVDVASFVGDTLPSSVTADISGEVASVSPLHGSGTLHLHEAIYGPWSVDSARATADARENEVLLRLSAAVPDSGRVGARARIRLDDGAVRQASVDSLQWAHLDVRTLAATAEDAQLPSTDLHGSGQGEAVLGDQGWTGSMTLDVAASTVGRASLDGGAIRIRTSPEASDLSLSLEAGEMLVEAVAHTSGYGEDRTFAVRELRFQELDLAALMSGDPTPTLLTGSASAEMVGARPEHAVGAARLDLWSSSIGTMVLDTASLVLSADSGRIETEARAEGLGGALQLEGEGSVEPATYSVRGTVERANLDEDSPDLAFMARFGLAGQGTQPDSLDAEIWLEVDSARWAGHDVERGSFRAGLGAGVLRLDTLSLAMPGAELAAGGELPLATREGRRGELRLRGTLTGSDLLRELRDSGVVAIGEAGIEATARGAVDDLELDGDAFVTALLIDRIRVQGMELHGEARRTATEGWVRGRGRLEVDRVRLPTAPIQSLEVDATLEPEDQLAVSASMVIDGRRDAELRMRVEQLPAPSVVMVENMSFRADRDRWMLAHPTRVTLRDGFHVDSLRFEAEGQRLELRGRIGPEGPLDFRAEAQAFDITTVTDLLGYPALRGRVDTEIDITGDATAPVLQASVRSRLVPQDAPASDLALALAYRDGSAQVEGSVTLDEGPGLRAEASMPFHVSFGSPSEGLAGASSMRGTVTAEAFPLRWFEPLLAGSGARDLEGRLDGTADLDGTPDNPSLLGQLTLRGGGVTLPELGVRYREASADVSLRGTEVVLDSARVRSEDGGLAAAGVVTLSRLGEPAYDLAINANRFTAMRSSAVHATISGQVDVRGTRLSPEVTGLVEVERADLYLEDLLAGTSVDAVTLTPAQWDELASVFGYVRPNDDVEAFPLMEAVTLDLDVRLGRASWVRQRANPELALQFSGELSVQKEPGDSLQLVGTVEAVPDRSWVEQFGRRFAITQGILNFQGPPSATDVEVEAQYDVPSRENPGEPEVVLILTVTGTPEDLNLELSSTPPLEASDMVAYLVTGRPASQSLGGGGEGSLTDAGGALVLGRLSGAVESYAREQIGLDVVEITTDGMDGVTLLAGRFVSPDLYLGVRQPMSLQRSSEDPTQRAPTTEIEMELQAVRWLLLNLRAGGRRGVEFYVRSRIAYD